MTDPKYIGIPNICFSLRNNNDARELIFREQRLSRGFDDSETWSLDYTIAKFIVPRLERYQEIAKEFLARDEKLVSEIDEFLEAMKLVIREGDGDFLSDEEQTQKERGLENFPRIFNSLWW
jgi:hypothetical protein